jgi:hypothetical protein
LRPLPVNAVADEELLAEIEVLAGKLPGSLHQIHRSLSRVSTYREYDAACNRASVHVWRALRQIIASGGTSNLLSFAAEHMTETARSRILRRLAKDPDYAIRFRIRKLVRRGAIREVALPGSKDGPWDATGWLIAGGEPYTLRRHPQGQRIQQRSGVPALANLAECRKLLDIRSESQLGYFLLASDADDGPYVKFTIPKRDGRERVICAPKPQLRWVQRRILDEILSKAPTHDAAHGFVPGRSIVTNAAPHQGAEIVVKFDLEDFFPTVHYYRVVGLFTRLGYPVGNTRFSADDESTHIAPTLARLCCYTPSPWSREIARLPQGAPTSPAISNLLCRRLDARLDGLAKRSGGNYTRYADDLTFSFKEATIDLGRLRWWVDQVCQQEGFVINHAKFRVIRRSQRQIVTGIVVNDSLHIRREDRRRFRAILHNCERHGLQSQSRGNPAFSSYLRGFASYLCMIDPSEGEECLQRVAALLGPEKEKES